MSSRDTSVTFRISAWSVLVVAVAALGLAGCTNNNPGLPTPTSDSGPGGGASGTSATTPAASDNWWHSVNACHLLDQATATGLGYPQPGQLQGGLSNDCRWTASDGSVIDIVLGSQRYDSLSANMGQLSDLTIAGRPAKQDLQAGGDPHGCDITIQATAGSDAYIPVSTLSSTAAEACQIAQTVATAIAPKLPRGSN
jgi:hypothetical protein